MDADEWGRKIVAPSGGPPPKTDISFPCPGLCRLFGMFGFLFVGLGIHYGGISVLGLTLLDGTASAWTGQHVVLEAAAVVCGGFAGLAGFAFGLTIKVRSENLNLLFSTLWQFLVNGGFFWWFAMGVTITAVLGRDEAKAVITRYGMERATGEVIFAGAIVGLVIGAFFFLAAKFRLRAVFYFMLSAAVALLVARWHFQTYGVASRLWIPPGLLIPVLLPLISRPQIEHSQRERRLLLEKTTERRTG